MKIEAKIWQDKDFWVIDISALNLSTQGTSREDAYEMAIDAVQCLTEDEHFKVEICEKGENHFYITSNDNRKLVGILLQRNRERQDWTFEDARQAIGAKSRSEFQTYEKGETDPTLTKLERLLAAIGYELVLKEKAA